MWKKIVLILGVIGYLTIAFSSVQAKGIKLMYVNPSTSGPDVYWLTTLIKDFTEQYPNIEIEVSNVGWDHHNEKILSMCAAGNPPAMSWADPELGARDWAKAGYLQPFDEWVKDWPDFKHFYKSLVQQFTIGGKLYALPASNTLMYTGGHYNPLIIKKFWGNPEDIKTWGDWLSVFRAVQNQEYEGHKVSGVVWGHHWNALEFFKALGRNNGPLTLGDFLDPTKKEAWLEVLEMYQKMSQFEPPGAESMDYIDADTAYVNGLTAFRAFSGSWMFSVIDGMSPETCNEERVGMMAGPQGPSHELPYPVAASKAYGVCVFQNIPASHKEAAWKFISFMISGENAARHPGYSGAPVRDDVTIEDCIKWIPYEPPEKYIWYLKALIENARHTIPVYPVEGANEVLSFTKAILLDLSRNKITVEEAYSRYYENLTKVWTRAVAG